MATIIFQGFNDKDNMMILNGSKRRVLSSQNIIPEINNERGLIKFTIGESLVGAKYQAKTIKMIMDEFVNDSPRGFLQLAYKNHRNMIDEFTETILNDDALEF